MPATNSVNSKHPGPRPTPASQLPGKIVSLHTAAIAILCLAISATHGAWEWVDPLPQGSTLRAVAVSGDQETLVSVGDYGACTVRIGQNAWTAGPPIAGRETLLGLIWSHNRFLAVGPRAGLWQSPDGTDWQPANEEVRGLFLYSLAGRIVSLGWTTSWVSTDNGNSFTAYSLEAAGIIEYLTAASDGSRVLVAGWQGLVALSGDGQTWERLEFPSNQIFFRSAAGAGGFLLAGYENLPDGSGRFFLVESADGEEWSEIPLPEPEASPDSLLWSGLGWLFSNQMNGGLFLWEGAEWARIAQDQVPPWPYASLPGPLETLLVGWRGNVAALDNTGDLVYQTLSNLAVDFLVPYRFSAAATGDLAAAVSTDVPDPRITPLVATDNALDWAQLVPLASPPPDPPRPPTGVTSLVAGGPAITAYANGDPLTTSGFYRTSNATDWSLLAEMVDPDSGTNFFPGEVKSFAANPGETAMVALTREESFNFDFSYNAVRGLFHSTDWANWTPVSLPALRASQPPDERVTETVQWDGSRFVLLLYPGRVFVSADGIVWSALPLLPEGFAATSVASNGAALVARVVALDEAGNYPERDPVPEDFFLLFEEGRWWPVEIPTRTPPEMRTIGWNGTRFYAPTDGGLLTSETGHSWNFHPTPAPFSRLYWSGTRYFAFTEAFAILTHAGELQGGEPQFSPSLTPRVTRLPATGGEFNLQLQVEAGTPWQLAGLPNWITAFPSSGVGPGSIAVTVAESRSANSRGAIFEIAGQTALLGQEGVRDLPLLVAGSGMSRVRVPFGGNWNASVFPADVEFGRGSSSGSGAVQLIIPANPLPTDRTFTVNVNGIDFLVTQRALPAEELRAGRYTGLLGYTDLPDPPESLEEFQTFDGGLQMTVNRPNRNAPEGSYTARLRFFDGTRTWNFRGRGDLDQLGGATNQRWTAGGRGAPEAIVNLRVENDFGFNQRITGTFEVEGVVYAFLAGKQIFHARTNPLPADRTARTTVFLGNFGSGGTTAEHGVGTGTIAANGTVRLAATLENGRRMTASTIVWGGDGLLLQIPLAAPLDGGRGLLGGYSQEAPTELAADWNGFANWQFLDPDGELALVYMGLALVNYQPPPRGRAPVSWNGLNSFLTLTENTPDGPGLVVGLVELQGVNRLNVVAFVPPIDGGRLNFTANIQTGAIRGQFSAPGYQSFTLVGAINQKFASWNSTGAWLGVISRGASGEFSIPPP